MSKIWFTSDTHFGHRNILSFCPNTRHGTTPDEMDRILIENWQRDVADTDDVYMLGDIFFCDSKRARDIMRQLPGRKHLIYGNHDKVIRSDHQLQAQFASINDYLELTIGNRFITLFHYPMLEWLGMNRGSYALFGHVHGNMDYHPEVANARIMDVGVDSRPLGIAPDNGAMSLWSWEQIDRMLGERPIRGFHNSRAV